MGMVLDQLSGNHLKYYPFKSFPSHSSQAFEDFAKSLQVHPHPAASKLTLLGSDNSEEQIGRARANLRRSLRRVQLPENEPAKAGKADLESLAERVPCKVQLVQGSISKVVQMLQGRPTLIVTNVPFGVASGGKQDPVSGLPEAAETYSRLGRLLRQQRAEWRGAYCLVAFAESFRNHTGLEWSSELRFLNGSRWVDLLQWSGTERRLRR
ncbi:unnamed protein product [Symbiodinium microadriaticum]|nr:unnamed protein product [Symbiodinium microadriaticum]